MPIVLINPLRWDWSHFAQWLALRPETKMPYISDKIARDIGMSPQELARLRHVWPSESADHPRI